MHANMQNHHLSAKNETFNPADAAFSSHKSLHR